MWISEKENEFINSEVGNEMEFRTSVAVELSILLTLQKRTKKANGLNHFPFSQTAQ